MEEKWRKLREIEAQRSKIIEKLEKIDEKKSTVSSEVYKKVKTEYETKLTEMEDGLAEYIDLIKEEITNLKKEEENLVEQQKEIKLKIEEVELRYSIGEYDDDSFKDVSGEYKKSSDALTTKLQKLRGRIKWFEDFVEIKGIEKDLGKEQKPEPKKETDIEIEEHILEEKPPEGIKLEELLVQEEAVKPDVSHDKEVTPTESAEPEGKQTKSPGVTCPKCGFVNAQDSWYCEKCGAEILGSLPEG